jgi:hypothetical protein
MHLPGRAGRSFAPLPFGPLGRQARELGLLRTKQHPARDRRLRHARRFHTWTATTRGALFWLSTSNQAASQASLCFGCHVDDRQCRARVTPQDQRRRPKSWFRHPHNFLDPGHSVVEPAQRFVCLATRGTVAACEDNDPLVWNRPRVRARHI